MSARRGTAAVAAAFVFAAFAIVGNSAISAGVGSGLLPTDTLPQSPDRIVQIAAGDRHTCALTTAGNVTCWGDASSGQTLGYPGGNAMDIAAAGTLSCAFLSTRNVACWGLSDEGPATGYFGGDAVALTSHGNEVCVLRPSDNPVCFHSGTARDSSGGSGGYLQTAGGGAHFCGLDGYGDVTCTGDNTHGQANSRLLGDAMAVVAGSAHTCILLQSGSVTCQGDNTYGQSADLTAPPVSPLVVPASATIIEVPGQSVTHVIPAQSSPPVGPVDVTTPPIHVDRVCAGDIFCAGPIDIPPQTIIQHDGVDPIPLTPEIRLTVSTSGLVAAVDPKVTTVYTIEHQHIEIPNPFGGNPIPVDVCTNGCDIPGVSVVDGAAAAVTFDVCVGATCESRTVPVVYGDTGPGQISFVQGSYSIVEGNSGTKQIVVEVQRTGGSFGDASVQYATQNGSAVAGSDYTAKSGALNWSHDDSSTKPIAITIAGDTAYEGNETFQVALSNATGAQLTQPNTTTVTIANDDNPPDPPRGSIALGATSYSVSENGVSVTIEVIRSGGSYGDATVQFNTNNGSAVAGSDYVDSDTQLTWTNGTQGTKTVTVPIIDDALYEGNETFEARLSNITGASSGSPLVANVTIVDNDPFPAETHTFDSGSGTVTIPSGATSVTITVWGGGGGGAPGNGGSSNSGGNGGGGGGSGARTILVRSVQPSEWGTTLNWAVGSGGGGSTAGGTSTSSGTIGGAAYSLSATGGGGGSGMTGGSGGTASGGTNTNGSAGGAGEPSGAGEPGGGGGNGGSAPGGGTGGSGGSFRFTNGTGNPGSSGGSPGAGGGGGGGGYGSGSSGGSAGWGASGRCQFSWS